MDIIYEDNYFVAINKRPGIPSQTDQTGDQACITVLENQLHQPLFILNRLDRPVSGVLLYAKSPEVAKEFSIVTKKMKIDKIYFAAVEHKPVQLEGNREDFLFRKNKKAYVSVDNPKAKKSVLSYRYICSGERYHLLRITLLTGRFHQIRAQLAHMGCPIKGDVKYGGRRANKDRSIHLHAAYLNFKNPYSGKNVNMEARPPDDPLWNAFLPYMKIKKPINVSLNKT